MKYKILESRGVEISHVDGAVFNNFSAGNQSGILKGVLDECVILKPDNQTLLIAPGELLIHGFRIRLDSSYTLSNLSNLITTHYYIIAHIHLSSDTQNVSFSIQPRTTPDITQDEGIFRNNAGIYELELCRFSVNEYGIFNLSRTAPIISSPNSLQVDQRYNPQSENAQSGVAVAQAVNRNYDSVRQSVENNSNRITNLEESLDPSVFKTNSEIAYVKIAPLNALPYAKIERVGGLSYIDPSGGIQDTRVTLIESGSANLIPFPYRQSGMSSEDGSVEISVKPDGSVHINTENPSRDLYLILAGGYAYEKFPIPSWLQRGKSYTLSSTPVIDGVSFEIYFYADDGTHIGYSDKFSVPDGCSYFGLFVYVNTQASIDRVIYPMLNSGSSALTFVSPAAIFDTVAIPESVFNLQGYGKGVSSVFHNYVDFEKRQFIQEVKSLTFTGAEDWVKFSTNTYGKSRFGVYLPEARSTSVSSPEEYVLATHYPVVKPADTENNISGVCCTGQYLIVYDENYQDISAWKEHLAEIYSSPNPFTVVYALSKNISTDISEYINDEYIKVQESGRLEFVNDPKKSVPSTIVYQTGVN